jgi:hypothetical protein
MNDSNPLSRITAKWDSATIAPAPIRRLIVLLPNADINEALFARALWTLAAHNGAEIHIVAMVDDWADEGRVRLRVALLAALSRESGIEPCTRFETDTDWIRIVRRLYTPGDVVVCHAEQRASSGVRNFTIEFKPLSTFIAALRIPVCELQGVIRHQPRMTLKRAIRVWVLPLLVIVASLVLEVLFIRWARDWVEWMRQFALLVYTAIEILVITRLTTS